LCRRGGEWLLVDGDGFGGPGDGPTWRCGKGALFDWALSEGTAVMKGIVSRCMIERCDIEKGALHCCQAGNSACNERKGLHDEAVEIWKLGLSFESGWVVMKDDIARLVG